MEATSATHVSTAPQGVRRPVVRARAMRFAFDPDVVPKHWLAGSPLATHISNGVSLLFPAGERFFVRSVHRYLEQVADDPELVAQIRGFFGQEGRHAREHERHRELLEAQGYEVRAFVEAFERSLRALEERFPDAFALAATAAGEHFTAILAEDAFADGEFAEYAHPVMAELLLWHAAEEIEHKAVAFDVLQRVAPSYGVRVAGMVFASLFLAYWWQRATRMLLRQDGLGWRGLWREARRLRRLRAQTSRPSRSILRDVFLRGIREYLRPGFHPWERDTWPLVADYVAALDARLDAG